METGYKITTTPLSDGKIVQEVFEIDTRQQIMRRIIDTQEQQTRDALIALGWTPPNFQSDGRGPKEQK